MKPTTFQRILSWCFPVRIWKGSSQKHSELELFLYQNQWQLETPDAVYSEGTRYRPVTESLKLIKEKMHSVNQALVLGCGLGSMVHIVNKKGFFPYFTLVDSDPEILNLAHVAFSESQKPFIKTVCCDAVLFIERSKEKYDLIFIDVFIGRKVPEHISEAGFVEKCRMSLNEGGIIIFNFMLNDPDDILRFEQLRSVSLAGAAIVKFGINRVMVFTA